MNNKDTDHQCEVNCSSFNAQLKQVPRAAFMYKYTTMECVVEATALSRTLSALSVHSALTGKLILDVQAKSVSFIIFSNPFAQVV